MKRVPIYLRQNQEISFDQYTNHPRSIHDRFQSLTSYSVKGGICVHVQCNKEKVQNIYHQFNQSLWIKPVSCGDTFTHYDGMDEWCTVEHRNNSHPGYLHQYSIVYGIMVTPIFLSTQRFRSSGGNDGRRYGEYECRNGTSRRPSLPEQSSLLQCRMKYSRSSQIRFDPDPKGVLKVLWWMDFG